MTRVPSASWVTTSLSSVLTALVAASATKEPFVLTSLLLILAVTITSPALVLVNVIVALPPASVVTVLPPTIFAPLSAVKTTAMPGTPFPALSVTNATTSSVATPSAFAPSTVNFRLPSVMPASGSETEISVVPWLDVFPLASYATALKR